MRPGAVRVVGQAIKAAGAWVFAGGLRPPESATVLQPGCWPAADASQAAPGGAEVLTTEGPYVEGKEHLGGFTLVEADEPVRASVGPEA